MKIRGRRLATALAVLALAVGGCASWEHPGVGVGDPGGVDVAPRPGGIGGAGDGIGGVGAEPNPGGGGPGDGMRPSIETPVPGQRNPVSVNVWKLEPSIAGHHVTVRLSWWSGPPPCSVLDSVAISRDGTTIRLSPFEGSDPTAGNQVACPAIAMLRGTVVDLGELEPGAWTFIASGDLAPIRITIE